MRVLPWARVHFVGLGGVGMTGLALILRDFGVGVSGSDAEDGGNLRLLRQRGAEVAIGHRAENFRGADVVVFSSAVPEDNPEMQAAAAQGVRRVRRGEFLAELAAFFPRRVSVAGSHGKTTTTAMLSHILIGAGWEPGYMVGGSVVGRAQPATAGRGEILVTEVDESDGTQVFMQNTHAIVVNAEDDHCWSVGGIEKLRECFRVFGERSEFLVTYETPDTRALYAGHPHVVFVGEADLKTDLALPVPGRHNLINASLALRMALELGVPEAAARAALATFQGVDRRLSCRYRGPQVTVIEDYAHHPSELHATLSTLRQAYPQGRLRVVFQPHRFERVARFCEGFARELDIADEAIVVPTFSAWVHDEHLGDPRRIVAAVRRVAARYWEASYEALAAELAASSRPGDVVAVLGAGSVSKLPPLLVAQLQAAGY